MLDATTRVCLLLTEYYTYDDLIKLVEIRLAVGFVSSGFTFLIYGL